MIDFWANTRIPTWIRLRRWWLPVLALWAAAVGISLHRHLDDLRRQSLEVASEGARNLFGMVVLTRAWNAGHGGVYVPVSDKAQPNPWLVHPRRDLETRDGLKLTMINPAYMTRQIGELALESKGTRFHITSLRPIRPDNRADDWERLALAAFEKGVKEVVELRPAGRGSELRYMAPLRVNPPCMKCHAVQGYRVGDVRGGISVTLPFDPILAASAHAREQTWKTHLAVFVLVALAGWGLLELLRRRWHDLADNMVALQTTGNALRSANAELARSRDQAEAASRSKSAFLNAMSHELRTPLNGILGFAHLLQRAGLPDKSSEQVRRIAEQGARLLELVNQVVEFTRLEGFDGVAAPGMVEPAAALADLADELRRKAAAKGLAVRVELAAVQPGRVAGSMDDLRGCLRPLLDNAVKFTDHGEVSLEARMEAGEGGVLRLLVSVGDSGIGIAETDRDKLFEPFHQLDGSLSRRHGGLGLGLALAARHAALLGARLDLVSKPGGGSRFTLDWPLRPDTPPAASVAAKGEADALLDRLERLLGEDDMGATGLWRELEPLLAGRFPGAALASLKRQVKNYDFPAALAELRALRGQQSM